MLTINQEVSIFVVAVLAGIIVAAAYNVIRIIRRLIPHKLWVISIEDLAFWLGTSIFLFVKMYETSDGSIRWFFIIGVALGAIGLGLSIKALRKLRMKFRKGIENVS